MSFENTALNKRNGETEDSHEVIILFHRCFCFSTTLNSFLRFSVPLVQSRFFCVILVKIFTTKGEKSGEIVNLSDQWLVEVDELSEIGIAASAGW